MGVIDDEFTDQIWSEGETFTLTEKIFLAPETTIPRGTAGVIIADEHHHGVRVMVGGLELLLSRAVLSVRVTYVETEHEITTAEGFVLAPGTVGYATAEDGDRFAVAWPWLGSSWMWARDLRPSTREAWERSVERD